jgi:hypothetical protein
MLVFMEERVPEEAADILAAQGGVVARGQSECAAIPVETMHNALRYGRWQPMYRGVYAPYTGVPTREAELWAALLRAGDGASLSYLTAAERHGLIDSPASVIHITVPASRSPARHGLIDGVIIHRSDSVLRTRHPAMEPPCTRVEDTVLDLIASARTFDEAYTWIARAIGRRRTTAERIREALDARPKFRWRREIQLALGEAGAGTHSWLELQYVRRVERPHGLPKARRQAQIRGRTGSIYLDNLYEDYGVCVELDGSVAHPAAEQWRDKRRDNQNLVREKILTLRFGFLDLRDARRQCETAALVAQLLLDRGLSPRAPHPCAAACPLPRPASP